MRTKRPTADHSEFRAALLHPPAPLRPQSADLAAQPSSETTVTMIGETPRTWLQTCLTSESVCQRDGDDPFEPMAITLCVCR